jgi:hypothetical protein
MKHSLGEREEGLALNFPHLHSRNFPRQSSTQVQAKSPGLGLGPLSLLTGAFTERGDSAAAPLPGGSSLLCITQVSQGQDLGLGFLMLLNSGDTNCPQVFCPSTATGSRTWPGEALTGEALTCTDCGFF